MPTVAEIKTAFARTYKGVNDAYFLTLLNQVDKLLVRHFGIRKDEIYLPVVLGEPHIGLVENALWVESARWIARPAESSNNLAGSLLEETNVDELDTSGYDWRGNTPGIPCQFMQTHDMAGGQIAFERPSNASTLTIVSATAATPIVATVDRDHGLSDGARVDIYNGTGDDAINGRFYVKSSGYGADEFALYEDSALTVPVASAGVYDASSAIVNAVGSPVLQLFVRYHEPLTMIGSLPATPMYPDIYTDGCCFLYAKRHVLDDVPKYKALFDDVIAQQAVLTQQRSGRKPMRVRVVQQRDSGFVRSSW